MLLDQRGRGFFEQPRILANVLQEHAHSPHVAVLNRIEPGAGFFGHIFGRFATVAEGIQNAFDQRPAPIKRHLFVMGGHRGGEFALVHLRDEFIGGVGDVAGAVGAKQRHWLKRTPQWQAAPRYAPKSVGVIRVRVPVDLHAIATTACEAFAAATPLRIEKVVELAVKEAQVEADRLIESARLESEQLLAETREASQRQRADAEGDLQALIERLTNQRDLLERQVRVYYALRELIDEWHLDFSGIKGQPELTNHFCTMDVAEAFLNDPYDWEGSKPTHVCSTESDMDAALTMQIRQLSSI